MPFQTAWVNGLQASFFASVTWASLLLVIQSFFNPGHQQLFTILLWAGGCRLGRRAACSGVLRRADLLRLWYVLCRRLRWQKGAAVLARTGLASPSLSGSATTPNSPSSCHRAPPGIPPVVGFVWALLYYRLRHAHRVALKFRAALKTGEPVIHRFFDAGALVARQAWCLWPPPPLLLAALTACWRRLPCPRAMIRCCSD